MSASQSTLAGWMRVQINVRNGKDASPSANAAAKLTPWHNISPARVGDGLQVYAVDFVPDGWVYTDPSKPRVAFSRDTYFTLAHDPEHLQTVIAKLQEGPPGLRRAQVTSAALKAEQELLGTATPDRLETLESDYRALLQRLREARENDDTRALGEGLKVVRELAERREQLQAELDRMTGYGETVKMMVRRLT